MSAVVAGGTLPPVPAEVYYAAKFLTNLGIMLNDEVGCGTCTTSYRARQVLSFNAAKEITEAETDVLKLYELACGHAPNDPTTDQGGNEQSLLTCLLHTGAPGWFRCRQDRWLCRGGFVQLGNSARAYHHKPA
jgi:hypothetical protein